MIFFCFPLRVALDTVLQSSGPPWKVDEREVWLVSSSSLVSEVKATIEWHEMSKWQGLEMYFVVVPLIQCVSLSTRLSCVIRLPLFPFHVSALRSVFPIIISALWRFCFHGFWGHFSLCWSLHHIVQLLSAASWPCTSQQYGVSKRWHSLATTAPPSP